MRIGVQPWGRAGSQPWEGRSVLGGGGGVLRSLTVAVRWGEGGVVGESFVFVAFEPTLE